MANTKMNVSSQAMRTTLRRYTREVKLSGRYFVPAFLLPGFGSILSLFAPALVISKILSHYQIHGSLAQEQFIGYTLWFVVIWLSGELLWRISEWFNEQGQYRGMIHLYSEALEELLQRDVTFFNNSFAGSLTKRALDYASNFEDFADKIGKNFVNIVITFIFSFVILWQFSPWLSLALIITFLVTLRGSFYFLRQRLPVVLQRNAASNRAAGTLADVISNMTAVKTFARESDELKRYKKQVKEHMDLRLRSWRIWNERHDAFVSPMYVLTNALGLVLSIYFGQKYGISSAAIFVTFSYFGRITRSLWELGPLYVQLERGVSDAAEHVDAMLAPPLVSDVVTTKKLELSSATVEFQNVNFEYKDEDQSALLFNNFNLTVASGEKIGLVGPSGGGKTTITKLLLRFMDIQNGTIQIGGQDITQVSQADLRTAIAYVPQEPVLFHRTLSENIRYGRPNASDKDVIRAAKLAHADEFIQQLPQGYDTLVGERGVKLSGGQRQRIAIARAILKDAPILVLDEATSALDSESEKLIQEALNRLMEGRTTLVIAHRLSTIQRMNRIIVLDKGEIIETGTHTELLKLKGMYAKLWAHQSGGFLEE